MEQLSLLTNDEFNPVQASTGKRFLNLLVDTIFVYIFVFLVLFVLQYSGIFKITEEGSDLVLQIIFFGLYLSYFSISEIIFSGRTIGKFITGTKTVNIDGSMPAPKTFLLRGLSRMVPFESFSALGSPSNPWHDKWTRTYVIDVKKTAMDHS